MSKRSKSLVGAAWAVLVMVALTFGATQAMASPISACNEPPQIGSCPPFTPITCPAECARLGRIDGFCNPDTGCCHCLF